MSSSAVFSAAAVQERSDRLIVQCVCETASCVCVCFFFICVCAAMSDRWCAYVVMSLAALQPFSLTSREGFRWQHSSLNHPHSGSTSRSSTVSPPLLQAPVHAGTKGRDPCLEPYRSLAADLFISLHQICQCHTCVIVQIYFSSTDPFSENELGREVILSINQDAASCSFLVRFLLSSKKKIKCHCIQMQWHYPIK